MNALTLYVAGEVLRSSAGRATLRDIFHRILEAPKAARWSIQRVPTTDDLFAVTAWGVS